MGHLRATWQQHHTPLALGGAPSIVPRSFCLNPLYQQPKTQPKDYLARMLSSLVQNTMLSLGTVMEPPTACKHALPRQHSALERRPWGPAGRFHSLSAGLQTPATAPAADAAASPCAATSSAVAAAAAVVEAGWDANPAVVVAAASSSAGVAVAVAVAADRSEPAGQTELGGEPAAAAELSPVAFPEDQLEVGALFPADPGEHQRLLLWQPSLRQQEGVS
mmetsp:Transcript_13075/g.30543  ORF Transcript_13075/g.30543 Transcript_13075/m.30543 type:complete len:220 (+) Transcript_13075:171-830(+)